MLNAAFRLVSRRRAFERALDDPRAAQNKLRRRKPRREPVLFHETTSGTTGAPKSVPYTPSLVAGFTRMFLLWADDVLRHGPRLEHRGFHVVTSTERADTEFLSQPWRTLVSRYLVPLESPRLEVISVWSPTYLEALLDRMEFPSLKFISAWDMGFAKASADRVRRRLPHVEFQGKGLLATEGAFTMPWYEAGGHVPLPDVTLYEFESHGRVLALDELSVGADYRLLATGDRVRCTGTFRGSPLLHLLGRGETICDLAGEKLSSAQLDEFPETMLLPHPGGRRYIALTAEDPVRLEARLFLNPHYALARKLGQLGPIETIRVPNLGAAWKLFSGSDKFPSLVVDEKRAQAFLSTVAAPCVLKNI